MKNARIEVLSQEVKSGNKNGKDWKMTVCQCVVREKQEDGNDKILVGELILPRGHEPIANGHFIGEFELAIGQNKSIGGQLVKMNPIRSAQSAAAPSKP